MEKKEIDATDVRIFYLCVHKKLDERVTKSRDRDRVMSKKEFYDILGRLYHLPKKLWCCVLKEMEEMNMVEDLGNKRNSNIRIEDATDSNIRINEMITDPEETANDIYQKFGIF